MKKILLIASLIFAAQTYAATDLQSKEHDLVSIKQQIKGLQTNIKKTKAHRDDLQTQLKKIELSVSRLEISLGQLHQALQRENGELARLQQQHDQLAAQLKQQQDLLSQQVRMSYQLGQNPFLRLLFNQQDPEKISRMFIYLNYLNFARVDMIQNFQTTLQAVQTNENKIQQHTNTLSALEKQSEDQHAQLQQVLSNRKSVLDSLNQQINNKNLQLQNLMENAAALEKLITHLQPQQAYFISPSVPFESLKGKLQWPVKGKLISHYGSPIGQSNMINNSVEIAAPLGTPVYAIYKGKVVFSDWLRGVGLLVIVDHGNGFMSLYGHNRMLLKHVGDVVAPGDEIATVGQSGGYTKTGLYFQLRYQGKPINPEGWCR